MHTRRKMFPLADLKVRRNFRLLVAIKKPLFRPAERACLGVLKTYSLQLLEIRAKLETGTNGEEIFLRATGDSTTTTLPSLSDQ